MGIEEEAVDKDDGEFEDVLTWTSYKTLWSVSPLSAIDLYLFLPNLNYIDLMEEAREKHMKIVNMQEDEDAQQLYLFPSSPNTTTYWTMGWSGVKYWWALISITMPGRTILINEQ